MKTAGAFVGSREGDDVGFLVGVACVGIAVGKEVGVFDGEEDGALVGSVGKDVVTG